MAKPKKEETAEATGSVEVNETTDGAKAAEKPAASGATKTGGGKRGPQPRNYILARKYEDADKLAPQAKIICDHLKLNEPVFKADLLAALAAEDKNQTHGNVLNTRQPVERVLAFYQKKLIETGLVKIENVEPPKTEEKTEEKGDKEAA